MNEPSRVGVVNETVVLQPRYDMDRAKLTGGLAVAALVGGVVLTFAWAGILLYCVLMYFF
ncbi:MAG TPA: hypothetical protein VGH49_11830 [Xanthobacteraceae bacterium]|jgi:hypothetical protein